MSALPYRVSSCFMTVDNEFITCEERNQAGNEHDSIEGRRIVVEHRDVDLPCTKTPRGRDGLVESRILADDATPDRMESESRVSEQLIYSL